MSGRIPQAQIEQVLARVNLVELVGSRVRLKQQGGRWVGLCPFHQEKTPSFGVNAARGLYHCFGCGASGNAIRFLMEQDGLGFVEAVEELAGRVGLTLEREGGARAPAAPRGAREAYFGATGWACAHWTRQRQGAAGEEARAYLTARGIDEATADAFQLGFAPPGWSGLVDAARRDGVALSVLEEAGLVIAREGADGHYDRFRHRVMFPIHGLRKVGNQPVVLAFSGRTLDGEERAKYINSPETSWYRKGAELYGLAQAQAAIRQRGEVVLVEGNFDVVSMHARGVTWTCAALGTALTPDQGRLLARFAQRVVLFYDGDSAGRQAARKAWEVLAGVGVHDVRWAQLPDGTDPDDLARREGLAGIEAVLERARPMLDILVDEQVALGQGGDAASRQRAAHGVFEVLGRVEDPLIRSQVLPEAGRRLGFDAPSFERAWRAHGRQQDRSRPVPSEPAPPGDGADGHADVPVVLAPEQAQLLVMAHDAPALLDEVHRQQLGQLLPAGPVRRMLVDAADARARGEVATLADWLARQNEPGLQRAMERLLASQEETPGPEALAAAWRQRWHRIKVAWVDGRLRALAEAMRGGEDEALLEQFRQLQGYRRELLQPRGRPGGRGAG
jgi:DNA primase